MKVGIVGYRGYSGAELIHLEMVPLLSDLQRSAENRLEEEHAVNHLAEALLKLDREK